MQKIGMSLNKADRDRILSKLRKLPKNVQRNAATSALNAGARVVRDKARAKAPACLRRSIKNVRLRQENGDPVTAVAAGVGMQKPDAGYARHFKKVLGYQKPCVAIWHELGTYGDRNLGRDPYAPATMRRYAKTGGKSPSPYWKVSKLWIPATPFLRPALIESANDGSIERAMAKKFNEYFKKIGV